MKFNYQGRTKDGDVGIGQVEASSQEAAITLLQGNGLFITLLSEDKSPFYARRIVIFSGVSRKDVVMFSRQLSIMFRSKVSLIEALRVLSAQIKNIDFKEKVFHISEQVEAGTSFSKALAEYPKVFSPFYVAMVRSGEISGKLSEVLNYLAEHMEREYHLTSKVRGALIYPSLVLSVVLFVLALMVFYVIPNLKNILETTGQELPLSTRMVLGFSDFARDWGLIIFLILGAVVFFLIRYKRTLTGKRAFDSFFLKIPLVGNLLKMIYVSRFSENLSTLISGGLPIVQALETTSDVMGNESYRGAISKAREAVRRGDNISFVLGQYPELFPPVFTQMAVVGEKTGNLDTVLMNIVDFYREEIDTTIESLLGLMEPLLIVFLGGVVGGIMLSILSPMYSMMSF